MFLYPNAEFEKVEDITIEFLEKNNIHALILDVDNTLIDYYRNLADSKIEWSNKLQEAGIKLYILSNTNKIDKVENVSKKLNINYIHFAKKPFKKGFLRIKEIFEENSENIGVVGDQIFTDVLGGNRSNMFTILVEPIDKKDLFFTMLKRPIEEYVKKRYRRKKENK